MFLHSVTKFSTPRRGITTTTTKGVYSKQTSIITTTTTTQRSYSSSSSFSSSSYNYSNYFRLASRHSRVSVSVAAVVPGLSQRKRVNYSTTSTTSTSSSSGAEEDQMSKALAEIESLLKNITDKRHKTTSPGQSSSVGSSIYNSSNSNSFSNDGNSLSSAATSLHIDTPTSGGESLSQAGNQEIPVASDPNALSNLKYMQYYPKIVRQWIIDAKTPKGIFNKFGEWETVPDTGENLSKLATQMIAQKALEGNPSGEKPLPKDLEGHYRFDIQPDEIENCHPKIKELFSFKYASQKEINAFRRKQIIKEIGKSPGNSGSSAVQVAILTDRINYMTEHLKKHPKDKSNQRSLMTLLETRRSMMKYLKRTNVAAYYNVLRKIGLRDMLP